MRLPSIIICLILLAGCTNNAAPMNSKNTDDINLTKISTVNNYSQVPSNQAKDDLGRNEEVISVKAVNTDNMIVIGVEIEHLERFNLAENREKYKKEMKKKFKDMDVELSTDMKINIELEKLEKDIRDEKISNKKLKSELKRIAELSKEQT